jgi:hypothetical protein
MLQLDSAASKCLLNSAATFCMVAAAAHLLHLLLPLACLLCSLNLGPSAFVSACCAASQVEFGLDNSREAKASFRANTAHSAAAPFNAVTDRAPADLPPMGVRDLIVELPDLVHPVLGHTTAAGRR